MSSPPRSSPASAPCRLEWRPSRWQFAAHLLITALAPWALCATDLSPALRWPASLLVLALGGAEAWWYWQRPVQAWLILPGDGQARCDGQPVEDLQLSDRGWLLQLAWRQQGRRRRCLFWPDTLPPAQRRELRLAVHARRISRSAPAMAP